MAGIPFTMSSEQYAEQIREAEKRGAVKALRVAAEITLRSAAELATATATPLVEGIVTGLATSIDQYANQIESGEVTL